MLEKSDCRYLGNTYYFDFNRFKKSDGNVFFWRLIDLLKPSIDGTFSIKTYLKAYCKKARFKKLSWIHFIEFMGKGVGKIYQANDDSWTYVSIIPLDKTILNTVCLASFRT